MYPAGGDGIFQAVSCRGLGAGSIGRTVHGRIIAVATTNAWEWVADIADARKFLNVGALVLHAIQGRRSDRDLDCTDGDVVKREKEKDEHITV